MRLQRSSRSWSIECRIPGNLCDLSKGYFATTFLSSSPPTPASQSGLHELTYGYRSNSAQFTRQPPERSQISSCDECGAFWSDDANGDRARSGLQPQHRSLDARPESC